MNRFLATSLVTLSHWLRSKKVILPVLLILVIGSIMRIYDLGTESLWLDEAISVKFSAGSVSSIITESGWGRASPPLYWVMLHYWMGWFGDGEAAVRSLSVIFAVGAILLTYLVGGLNVSGPGAHATVTNCTFVGNTASDYWDLVYDPYPVTRHLDFM